MTPHHECRASKAIVAPDLFGNETQDYLLVKNCDVKHVLIKSTCLSVQNITILTLYEVSLQHRFFVNY